MDRCGQESADALSDGYFPQRDLGGFWRVFPGKWLSFDKKATSRDVPQKAGFSTSIALWNAPLLSVVVGRVDQQCARHSRYIEMCPRNQIGQYYQVVRKRISLTVTSTPRSTWQT